MTNLKWGAPLLAVGLVAGCVEQELDVSAEAGAVLFADNCAGCHGADAKGAGEFGVQLFNIPPDLTRLSEQYGGVFPRDYVLGVIDGFHRDPAFSTAMPEFGAGDMGPTVIVEENGLGTPIPARLLALSQWLESVQE
ncbi:cytochrome c [Octadecabacter sp. G9-8]|uniref:Cytochrome c n=1 Tax=Octadecabacter dasysiphoniae TaxID=2909341 RepID=A0ABS9CYJ4_9RHOB|nr:cytochrome c [Octadecabacter dasysiphoniae]MCF2871961.1 cytochrome c [Octadecabacter dasysiphoniae]